MNTITQHGLMVPKTLSRFTILLLASIIPFFFFFFKYVQVRVCYYYVFIHNNSIKRLNLKSLQMYTLRNIDTRHLLTVLQYFIIVECVRVLFIAGYELSM